MLSYPSDMRDELKRKPICGVMAVAVIAGVTFAKAEEAIKRNLMSFQKRHGGRTHDDQVRNALAECGVSLRDVPVTRKTFLRWAQQDAQFGKTYLVRTTDHYITVQDGWAIDQYQHVPSQEASIKRCFVTGVWEVA